MQVTTLSEARALVGRTFERDGRRRKLCGFSFSGPQQGVTGCIWNPQKEVPCECGANSVFRDEESTGAAIDEFNDWLSEAREVQ